MGNETPQTGENIALQAVNTIHIFEQKKLEQALVTEQLNLEIEKIRLQVAKLKQERMITEYGTNQIFNALSDAPVFNNLEYVVRMNLVRTLGEHSINSIQSTNPTIPETTGNKPKVDAETTAKEVPPAPAKQEEKEQNTTEAKADIAPPTAKSESMDAPKETPQTPPANNGSTGSQA